jgi:hypothetical protein
MRSGARTDLEPSANLHEVSLEQAAQMLKVSRRSAASGRRVLLEASPELIAAIERGETTIGAAERLVVEKEAAGIVASHEDQSARGLLGTALDAMLTFGRDGAVSEATVEEALAAIEAHPDRRSVVVHSEYLMVGIAFMDRLTSDDPRAVPHGAWDGLLTMLAAWGATPEPDDCEAIAIERGLIPKTWPVEREAEVFNGLERIEERARRAGLPDGHLLEIRLARFLALWRLGKALNRLEGEAA